MNAFRSQSWLHIQQPGQLGMGSLPLCSFERDSYDTNPDAFEEDYGF